MHDIQWLKTLWADRHLKAPLKKLLLTLLSEYPEPHLEECTKPNAQMWLAIRDKYLTFEKNEDIWKMARLFFNVIIDEYQHDAPYEERLDFICEEIIIAYLTGKYKPRGIPAKRLWDEPMPLVTRHKEKEITEQMNFAITNNDLVRASVLKAKLDDLIKKRWGA